MAEKTKSQVMGAHLRVTAAAGMFVAALAVGGCHNANRVEDPNARYIATLTCRVRAEMASMLRSGAPAGPLRIGAMRIMYPDMSIATAKLNRYGQTEEILLERGSNVIVGYFPGNAEFARINADIFRSPLDKGSQVPAK